MKQAKAPSGQARGRLQRVSVDNAQLHSSPEPVAFQVYKPGRGSNGDGWVTVGKVTHFIGSVEPIFAVAIRKQRGTTDCISVPLLALDYAEAAGCRWLYWRHDRSFQMRRLSLKQLRDGWPQEDGELYVPLSEMEAVPWRKWPYAEKVVRLRPHSGSNPKHPSEPATQQLSLFGDAA